MASSHSIHPPVSIPTVKPNTILFSVVENVITIHAFNVSCSNEVHKHKDFGFSLS